MRSLSTLMLFALLGTACTGAPTAPPPVPSEVPPAPEPESAPEPLPAPTEARYAATQVQIAFAGAVGAPAAVTRTEEEARSLAEDLRTQALAGADLEALARAHSDAPSGRRGGSLGVYLTGTLVPEVEAAVASVAVGEIAPLARSPFGYHVLRRDAVQRIHAHHLLVTWAGTWRSVSKRTRAEAEERIAQARARVARGESFAEVARAMSDDEDTAARGGDLGAFGRGQLLPAFEDAAFALAPGDVSDVVETPYGLHLIWRTE